MSPKPWSIAWFCGDTSLDAPCLPSLKLRRAVTHMRKPGKVMRARAIVSCGRRSIRTACPIASGGRMPRSRFRLIRWCRNQYRRLARQRYPRANAFALAPVVAWVREGGGDGVEGHATLSSDENSIPPASPVHAQTIRADLSFARRVGLTFARSRFERAASRFAPNKEKGRGITPRPERTIGYKWARVKK